MAAGYRYYAVWRVATIPHVQGVIAAPSAGAWSHLRFFFPGHGDRIDGQRFSAGPRGGTSLRAALQLYRREYRRHGTSPNPRVYLLR